MGTGEVVFAPMDPRRAILHAQQAVEIEFGISAIDAEDIVSAAVLVVCLKWGAQHVGNSALLRSVARHEARHFLRQRRKLKVLPLDLDPELQAQIPPAAADDAAAEVLLLDACRIAGIQSEGDVSLLKMVWLKGFSYTEAGKALGASEDVLRQRVSRLRRRLRNALSE